MVLFFETTALAADGALQRATQVGSLVTDTMKVRRPRGAACVSGMMSVAIMPELARG